jgi:hypothetical protein
VFWEKLESKIEVREFDTDVFGTFTGEVARTLSAYDTCVLKAKKAAQLYGYELSIANEGSFGAHPAFPFVPSDNEIMVFLDLKNNFVIAEQLTSLKTNYGMLSVTAKTDLTDFLEKVGFPAHAVNLQKNSDKSILGKGINDIKQLEELLAIGFKDEKELFISTDMRAMMNPTRMQVIGELAEKLITRVVSLCASCSRPGFGFKTTTGNLPCELCNLPTTLYAEEVWGCIGCDYKELKKRPDGLLQANPSYCNFCNP